VDLGNIKKDLMSRESIIAKEIDTLRHSTQSLEMLLKQREKELENTQKTLKDTETSLRMQNSDICNMNMK